FSHALCQKDFLSDERHSGCRAAVPPFRRVNLVCAQKVTRSAYAVNSFSCARQTLFHCLGVLATSFRGRSLAIACASIAFRAASGTIRQFPSAAGIVFTTRR